MTDFTKFDEYELNEMDIDSMLNYLRIFDPKNATPENAIDFLEFYRTAIHKIGHEATDEDLKKLYDKFTQEKNDK
jgi:hypothetical protein